MQSRTRLWVVAGLGLLGLLSLAAAGILKWAVVPGAAKLPSDENTTRQYSGSAKVLLNPQALSTGDLSTVLLANVPVTATRNVKTLATSGGVAQVQDTRTLSTANGQPIGTTQATYAVDRKTLEATSDHPSDWQVTAAKGLTVSFPIGAERQNYTGWVPETQTTTTLKFLRQETKQGLTTYVYQATTQPAPITDPQVLSALPPALPGSALQALSSLLSLPPAVTALLPQLTQPVPVTYTYQVNSTYWVEPTTGLVVDTQREDIRAASLSVAGQTIVSGFRVFDVTTAFTSASVANAANDAMDKKNTIDLYSYTVPLLLLMFGILVLIATALVFWLSRSSPHPPSADTTPPSADTTPPDSNTAPPAAAAG